MSTLIHDRAATPAWLDLVRQKVEGLRYGQVYIVVHDQQVTQVECLEKTRLAVSTAARAAVHDQPPA
ncbi:MAG TPA: YezD family protein [Opitutales bacterium]|nr:YezD family protein [Opitutales bacterium]